MRCRKARNLIAFYLAPDESWLSPEDRQALEAHMAVCESCRLDCEETAKGIALFQKYWHISPDTQALIDRANEREAAGLPVDPRWRFRRIIEIGIPASAVAACLAVLVLGGWLIASHLQRPNSSADAIASAEAEAPLVIASADGGRIESGAVIETQAGQIDRLTLNGRHTIVMNADTRLSIEPLVAAGRVGCQVNLTLGEVYVHVEHDGNPFVVQTTHGRAVITGTTFDVKVTGAGTTLVVAEGSVRFESQAGMVQVAGGRQSTIVMTSSPPSMPATCDVVALTAWAGAGRSMSQVAQAIIPDDILPAHLPVVSTSSPRIDLETLDYIRWVDQNHDWFRLQFPEIFRLQDALAKEGIKADYTDLLLESGVLWQFAWPPAGRDRLLAAEEAPLIEAANRHGKDLQWLKDRGLLPIPPVAPDDQKRGMEAFTLWQSQIAAATEGGREAPVEDLLDSLHACAYLQRTRSLLWLAIEADRYSLSNVPMSELQALLQAEVTVADAGVSDVIQLLTAKRSVLPCDSDPYRQLVGELHETVVQMARTEGRLTDGADSHP